MTILKCPNCGADLQISDGIHFCQYCGAKIQTDIKRSRIEVDVKKEEKKVIVHETKNKAEELDNLVPVLLGIIVLILVLYKLFTGQNLV